MPAGWGGAGAALNVTIQILNRADQELLPRVRCTRWVADNLGAMESLASMEIHNIDHPPLSETLTLLFLFGYPLFFWMMVRRHATIDYALPATLVPLFVGLAMTWTGLVNAMRGLAISGGSATIGAAIVADVQFVVTIGAIVAGVASLVSFLRDALARDWENALVATRSARTPRFLGAMLVSLAILLLSGELAWSWILLDDLRSISAPPAELLFLLAIALAWAGAITSFVWLKFAHRLQQPSMRRRRLAHALACLLLSLALAGGLRFLTLHARSIAIRGWADSEHGRPTAQTLRSNDGIDLAAHTFSATQR